MTKDAELKYPPEYVPEYDLTIYRVPMTVGEGVSPNAEDAGYTAYVNEDAEDYQAIYEALHAIKHTKDQDFQKDNVQQIESDAHRIDEEKVKAALQEEEKRKKRIARGKALIEKERKKLQKEMRAIKKTIKKNKERDEWLESQGYDLDKIRNNKHEWDKMNPY